MRYASDDLYEKWMPRKLQAGDILLSSEAPLGEVAYLRDGRYCLGQRLFALRPDSTKLDARYLFYWLRSSSGQQRLAARATGTTVLGIRQSELLKIELDVPPVDEQRAIADVLGALDDKIELNRRMNQTLAGLAEAIYTDLLESTHQVARLGDVLELAYGRALKESDRRLGPVLVYGSNGIVGRHDQALSPGPGVIVGRKGNPGVVTWADEPFHAIDTTFYVVPRLSGASLYHLYFALRKLDLASFAADSAVPGLNRNIAYGLEIEIPEAEALQRFDGVVSSLFAKRAANERESRTLAELRDMLLPKLIGGKVSVGDG